MELDDRSIDEIPPRYKMKKSPEDDDTAEVVDPWALVVPKNTGLSWKEKSCSQKMMTLLQYVIKIAVLIGLLYLFICSLGLLSDAFRLLGGKTASAAFRQSEILGNPVANLMMGVLATVLLQSSSTTTSIVVAMVASEILPVRPAIFIIMGANIGTSVTNTIVSLGQCGDRNQFRRSFAGATVHDMFNWLTVIILLPIEWISGEIGSWKGCGLLCQMTHAITKTLEIDPDSSYKQEILKVVTKPFTRKIIQLDKKVLIKLAHLKPNETELADSLKLIKVCHKDVEIPHAVSVYDNATQNHTCTLVMERVSEDVSCGFIFEGVRGSWSEAAIGGCLFLVAIVLLMVCLVLIVKLLSSLLKGSIAVVIQKILNSNFPSPFGFLTGYIAILVGWGMTMVVQSSSIFTSTMTPLVGAGILHIKRMYPLTLGANIGTTFTAVLASLAADRKVLNITLQVALCHLFFNIIGIIIWYPVPTMRRIPIELAKKLGDKTAKHRWFAFVYILSMFFLMPAAIFGVSIAGWKVALGVLVPVFVIAVIIVAINLLQSKKPESLPEKLKNWDCLPLWCHSLKPYDKAMGKVSSALTACGSCRCCRSHKEMNVSSNNTEMTSFPRENGKINPPHNGNGNMNLAFEQN